MKTHPTIGAAIAAVIKDTSEIQQTGKNSFHKYNYATDYDVTSGVRRAMGANGVACLLHKVDNVTETDIGKQKRWVARFVFRYIHAGGPDFARSVCYAGGQANDEKAPLKALTSAKKYSHLVTFTIASSLDPEKDPPAESAATSRPTWEAEKAPTTQGEREARPTSRELAGFAPKTAPAPTKEEWHKAFDRLRISAADRLPFADKLFAPKRREEWDAIDLLQLTTMTAEQAREKGAK
jgi:hypothetical protein